MCIRIALAVGIGRVGVERDGERRDDRVAVEVGVVDEEARVVGKFGWKREAEQAAFAARRDPVARCRGTARSTRAPSATMRIRPPCSTTKSRPVPSSDGTTSIGLARPDVTVSRRRPVGASVCSGVAVAAGVADACPVVGAALGPLDGDVVACPHPITRATDPASNARRSRDGGSGSGVAMSGMLPSIGREGRGPAPRSGSRRVGPATLPAGRILARSNHLRSRCPTDLADRAVRPLGQRRVPNPLATRPGSVIVVVLLVLLAALLVLAGLEVTDDTCHASSPRARSRRTRASPTACTRRSRKRLAPDYVETFFDLNGNGDKDDFACGELWRGSRRASIRAWRRLRRNTCAKGSLATCQPCLTIPTTSTEARKLLTAAGYPNGFKMTLFVSSNRFASDVEAAQALAQMWTRLGVDKLRLKPSRRVHFQNTTFQT